jgi:hypothetical protein
MYNRFEIDFEKEDLKEEVKFTFTVLDRKTK